MENSVSAQILFVGDMHLGRSPARLPDVLHHYKLSARELGPPAAWRATVSEACRREVDAVVLAGDVVEKDNARFEARGLLQEGVNRLTAAGIAVCAVAGNHDVDLLPRLAQQIDGFHLLGAGGTWSDFPIVRDGVSLVRLLGWSFPERVVQTSPLASALPTAASSAGTSPASVSSATGVACPTLGVLHCDLDAGDSRYAPVRSADLALTDVAGWFLGHIHKPTLREDDPAPGYLGSLVGLDPTETGRHGPWLVTVTAAGRVTRRHLPLAPLRWERLEVPVENLRDPRHDLELALGDAVTARCQELADELAETRAIGWRVHLTGRTTAHRELGQVLADPAWDQLILHQGDVVSFLAGRIRNNTAPARDLARLAASNDPAGLLARELQALERGEDLAADLVAAGRVHLATAASHSNFGALDPPSLGDTTVRGLLLEAGYRALEELLAQREGVR